MKQQHQYSLVHLERPPGTPQWGMAVSFFDSMHLIIGAVHTNSIQNRVIGLFTCLCPLDPSVFWKAPVDVVSFERFLVQSHVSLSTTGSSILMPGDCILAINHRSIYSFGSLQNITDCLKACNRVCFLVLRKPQAIHRAHLLQNLPQYCKTSPSMQIATECVTFYQPVVILPAQKKDSDQKKKDTNQKNRSAVILRHIRSNFDHGIDVPKQQWCSRWHDSNGEVRIPEGFNTDSIEKELFAVMFVQEENTLFRDSNGKKLLYSDNVSHFDDLLNSDPDEGARAPLFLRRVQRSDFYTWLANRKQQWRKRYHVHRLDDHDDIAEWGSERAISADFWTHQGFSSFQQWLSSSTRRWKASYSWNKKKRKRIEKDSELVVHLSDSSFPTWLRVRKNQWRVSRRERQRKRQDNEVEPVSGSVAISTPEAKKQKTEESGPRSQTSPTCVIDFSSYGHGQELDEFAVIDALLEDRERKEKASKIRFSFDLLLLFDQSSGAPDDVVVHFLSFLETREHLALLCLNKNLRHSLIERGQVWRSLCPSRWTLPRRPRKPWHEHYFVNLLAEKVQAKKRFDDLLSRVAQILLKGDQLNSIEKLVAKAEREFQFDVNYSSGVVCERNSILNLATIHKRHKTVKWLVEIKGADISSQDRGSFSPLLNAAWNGDRHLVRLFLSKGADRKHVGTCHYTRPLAAPDFEGRNAAGWARDRGHYEVAKLIELGL